MRTIRPMARWDWERFYAVGLYSESIVCIYSREVADRWRRWRKPAHTVVTGMVLRSGVQPIEH